MDSIWADLKFAARLLVKKPAFTAIAITTLALGIGANSAVFSVVNALLFRPLPFREPERLVWIASGKGKPAGGLVPAEGDLSGVTTQVGNFIDWRDTNQSFEDLAAYFAFFDYGSYTLTGSGEPERLRGVGVTENFLPLLGVEPAFGRGFTHDESVWNGSKAVLLTDGFWRRRFAANPSVVGQTIT